jgi:hypothetical protein
MIPSIKSSEYLYEIPTGEGRVGSKQRRGRGRKRATYKWRGRRCIGQEWKWPLAKKYT